MANRPSAQTEMDALKRRQQMGPFIIGGLAVIFLVVGILLLVLWLTGPNAPSFAQRATETPTPTLTNTPTPVPPTATPTETPTETLTPTVTLTPTPSGPFEYTVLEGDNCWDIAVKFNADLNALIAINNWDPGTCPINPGDVILIPLPDQTLPTPTVPPPDVKVDVQYVIQGGDSLETIAARYNSTVEAILAKNKDIKNRNDIKVGQVIIVPANIVTPTPTKAPTSTRSVPTATPTPTATQQP